MTEYTSPVFRFRVCLCRVVLDTWLLASLTFGSCVHKCQQAGEAFVLLVSLIFIWFLIALLFFSIPL